MSSRSSHHFAAHDCHCAPAAGALERVDGSESGLPSGVIGSSRRSFLLMVGAAALAGCSTNQPVASVPEPVWPSEPIYTPRPMPMPAPRPSAPAVVNPAPAALPSGVIARSRWAKAPPDYSDMERMLPVKYVTIHHDALSPFLATDAATSEARLELIRSAHRNKRWADIGYHYVIDRAGRVYEARPVTWQGAHVKDHNEGNIGVLCMGNFEVQSPSEQQLNALVNYVQTLRQKYKVNTKAVLTHREWRGAQTLCPGVNMQRKVATMRQNKAWA